MKLPERKRGSMIGLDIGSSAVRAAEVVRGRHGLSVSRFGQVGLPNGAVVRGEVADPATVATAIRRLWADAGFGSRRAVVALSGQRVIVRQAEVPSMSAGDFRSALGFQAMELIPIPVDDAVLDFVIVPPSGGSGMRADAMDIVLAAAHRGTIQGHLAALSGASVHPVALAPAPMAEARVVARAGGSDAPVALVDIGADLSVVTVVERGTVRFSRILAGGGADVTNELASRRSVGRADAEAMKRQGRTSTMLGCLDPLVGEVESTLGFFASQLSQPLERVLLTGGSTRDEALVEQLATQLSFPVGLLDPFDGLDISELDMELSGVTPVAGLALGCAEWAWAPATGRVSLLPREHATAARQRQQLVAVAVGVLAVAGGLTAAGVHREAAEHREQAALTQVNAESAAVTARESALQPVQAAGTAIQQRLALLDQAGQDDIAWSQLLNEITAAMPAHTHLTSLSFTGPSSSGAATGSSSTAGTTGGGPAGSSAGPLGSITMGVGGSGTEEQVAVWLRAFRDVPGIQAVWVPSASAADGKVTFTSSGGLEAGVPMVHRSEAQS